MRRARARFGSVLVGLVAIGCSNTGSSGVSFPFSRPEHLGFLCFAPNVADHDDYEILPRACCQTVDASRNEDVEALPYCAQRGGKTLGTPVLHALVTQSSRGEVAAVDLDAERVLDSERAVPGYTFIDSGGLPSAIVAPAYQPLADPSVGPAWTYVASAEENQVRAIASCRFRTGRVCGPELTALNSDETARIKRTRLSLPAAPYDMVLGHDQALWLTLPDLGRIARIALPANEEDPDQAADAFVMASADQPAVPFFYSVPAAPDAQPLEPVAEIDEYLAACGLDYPVQTKRLQLPLAPRTSPTAAVRPTRLKFDQSSGILFVADEVAPVLHAFVPQPDGTLEALGALPTGTPVKDFVITPPVPTHAADLKASPSVAEDPNADTERYLYAIDDRGLVMVFSLAIAEGRPSLQPLLVPTPGTAYADRIELPTPSASLEVIDTRLRSTYVCGEPTPVDDHATQSIDELNAEKARLTQLYKGQTAPPLLQRINARVDVYDAAGPNQLRGVFVVAASASGLLSVIDVHDLDAPCRARKECCAAAACVDDADLTKPRDSGTEDAVAIRRHTIRRSGAGDPDPVIADASKLIPWTEAPTSYRVLADGPALAVPADPWTAINATWSIRYQSVLFGGTISKAVLEQATSPQLVVRAPAGLSLCERGVRKDDLVAIVGNAPEYLARNCPDPTEGSEVLLKIDEAYDDHLLVTVQAGPSSQPEELRDRLLFCYPDFAGIELRAGGFIVESADRGISLHRVIAGPDGRCVDDETKDPLLTSRPVQTAEDATHWSFRNPYVAFTFTASENPADRPGAETSVQVRNASTSLQVSNQNEQIPGALPSEVRYMPEVGELFVLDTAGQELRRYTLAPFEWDRKAFR